jgi:hypothetical protein
MIFLNSYNTQCMSIYNNLHTYTTSRGQALNIRKKLTDKNPDAAGALRVGQGSDAGMGGRRQQCAARLGPRGWTAR